MEEIDTINLILRAMGNGVVAGIVVGVFIKLLKLI